MKSKKLIWNTCCILVLGSCTPSKLSIQVETPIPLENTLLWQISGNGLDKPSYLFGTIHRLCKDEAVLSDSLKFAINETEQVYFEVDMDNLIEMVGVIRLMKMKNDTTLADLLSKKDYEKMKNWFESRNTMLPFSVLETYKPLLAASTITESNLACDGVAMEQVIMEEAKKGRKRINGLETMAYQMSIFDSIPYKLQAEQLLKYIENEGGMTSDKEYQELVKAYKEQDLEKLGKLITTSDIGSAHFEDILLYNRNRNWVKKLKNIMSARPVTVAVGAGHLPGLNGVINLLRKEGYTVKAVLNKMVKQTVI